MVRYPNAKQFRRELDGDRLEGRYLFLGEEEGEKEKCVNRIIVMAFDDPAERAHATGRFHVENGDFPAAVDFALSPPMFSSRRVCVMYHVESLGRGKRHGEFDHLLENLPDSTLLILTSRENRPPPFMEAALGSFKVVQFWRYFENDIYAYIAASIQKLGLALEDRAVDLLVERTGSDIKKIDDAIDMIRFSGETGPVAPDTILNFIDDVKDASVFDFIDALFKGEARAMGLYRKVFEDGTPGLRVLYLILRQADMLERYHAGLVRGLPPEEAMNRAGVFRKGRDDFRRQASAFPVERLRRVFALAGVTDWKLKSGGSSRDLIADPVFGLVSDILYAR